MATRNFWVCADIEGRQTLLEGGPKRRDGGLSLKLYQRDEGAIETALTISCREHNGNLYTSVRNHKGDVIYEFETKR